MLPTEDDYVAVQGPRIFEDMLRNAGGETNYGIDANRALGRFWANAHGLARVQWLVEKVGEQPFPVTSDLMLEELEWEYGAVPRPGMTLEQRRALVATLAKLPVGARLSNIQAGLSAMLGDDFVAFVTTNKNAMSVSNDDARSEVTVPANLFTGSWDAPSKGPGLFKLAKHVCCEFGVGGDPLSKTVRLIPLGGNTQLGNGQRIVFDLGTYGRTEALRVEVDRAPAAGANPNTLQGQYELSVSPHFPHDKGGYVLSGRVPALSSTKRHSYVVLTEQAALDPSLRSIVHSYLRRVMRGVSTWSITAENSPGSGTAGPFDVETGVIGITPIQEITF